MIISIIGPSGSGKDTQARFIAESYNIPNISTGKLMRDEIESESELGKEIDSIIGEGKWLPDDMTLNLLMKRLEQPDINKGFILNGYPRTYAQIAQLDNISKQINQKLGGVIHFELEDDEIIRRMRKQAEVDTERTDLDEDAIRSRLQFYKATIHPIVEEYRSRGILINIDASPSIERVRQEIALQLKAIGFWN